MPVLQRVTLPTVEVLRLLADTTEPVWGLRIAKLAGRPPGTVYPILSRLEEAGWLEAKWEADSDRAGPRRRFYELTAEGAIAGAKVVSEYVAKREPQKVTIPRPAAVIHA